MNLKFSHLNGSEANQNSKLMESAYRLRHKIFVDEMGWEELQSDDSLENDQFDTDEAIHMFLHAEDKLIGYQRLLPTTKPYLLSEIYPHLCEVDVPRAADTWEWTRFAVLPEYRKGVRKLSYAGNILLSGIVEWGLENRVNQIVIEMNPLWMLMLPTLHFRAIPLGIPHSIAGNDTIAVVAKFDERTLVRLREFRGDTDVVLQEQIEKSAG
ncbi:MAG: acyl-homoserine-lactone synthase [Rhizobiaceae bacterium]